MLKNRQSSLLLNATHGDGRGRLRSAGRRSWPSIDQVLQALGPVGLPRAATLAAVRKEIAGWRQAGPVPGYNALLVGLRANCERLRRQRLQPVINGTGRLLHPNLGRAPLGARVVAHLTSVAANFNNLEYDLVEGTRSPRATYLECNLAVLCGAEAATVVNNGAAALVLILGHFTRRKPEVLLARAELLQTGGGLRLPEILEASGATLRAVGTTNQTALADYAHAIGPQSALLLKVPRSNSSWHGFVDSPAPAELAALAHTKRLPFVEALGSGAVFRTETIAGLEHEPSPVELLKQGVDLVTFSGDKLFGGPQAGIIVGKAKLIAALKREPFARALRCDKLVLAALETTVDLHLEGAPEGSLPLLTMLQASEEELRQRAERLVAELGGLPVQVRVGKGKAQVGGGHLPRGSIPSVTLELVPQSGLAVEFATRMRLGFPPVIGYVAGGCFRIDLRTVFAAQDEPLVHAIRAATAGPGTSEPAFIGCYRESPVKGAKAP